MNTTSKITYFTDEVQTPVGGLTIFATELEICSVFFSDSEHLRTQRIEYQESEIVIKEKRNALIDVLLRQVTEYFAHTRKDFHLPLLLSGTLLQNAVWEQLQKIPYGQTVSYLTLATMIKKEKAVRAVATSCGKNPFVLVIPCHRVIASNGTLGGYSGGLWRKEYLLLYEKREK